MNGRAASYLFAGAALVALTLLAFAVGRYPVTLPEIVSRVLGRDVPANVEPLVPFRIFLAAIY